MSYSLSSNRINELNEMVNNLSIQGINLEYLDVALTHPSFYFEQPSGEGPNYQRLEFFGDSVLRLSISEYVFNLYPDSAEGKLSKLRSYLVSDDFLHNIALKLRLDKYLNIGKHEEKDGGRTKSSILACAMEATFGAIYLSLGFDYAKNFIISTYSEFDYDINEILYIYNSKEILQQYTQSVNKDLPVYEVVAEQGQAHDRLYEIQVSYHGEVLGTGIGKTKKEAEKSAAFNAIKSLNLIKE